MASAAFRLGHSLRRGLAVTLQNVDFSSSLRSGYSTSRSGTLAATIYPLGHPSISLVPELDRWIGKGKKARPTELQMLLRYLRRHGRFKQALEVSEWMKSKGIVTFMPGDLAVQLDLIGKVRGLASAETYFDSMHESNKTEKTYGALLKCLVREGMIEKSLAHMQKMKNMGFATSALCYNNLMCLYTKTGQHDKVPVVFAQMKTDSILPDNFSYRICINALGRLSDISGMEGILEEMEQQPHIVVDWNTYSVVASIYIKAELADKAISMLQKAESKLEKKNGLCYNHLISLFGQLGNIAEMWRIWELQESNGNTFINRDYTTMLQALVKHGEMEEAEKLLTRWESSGNSCDFRVVNILLHGYRQKGLLDKAEALVDDFVKKGKSPSASSWGIVAVGFAEQGQMAKAHKLMKNALCVYAPRQGWVPNPMVVKKILHWLGEEGDLDSVKMFINLLNVSIPMDKDMYTTLIKANLRAGKDIEDVLKCMSAADIEIDKEILEKLTSTVREVSA